MTRQRVFKICFGHESKNIAYSLGVIVVAWLYCLKLQRLSYCLCIIFLTGYGLNISSNMFCRMMKYLPATKHPLVSSFEAEAATVFKILQFTCIGPFRRSYIHFEGIPPKKYIMQRNCVLLVQSYMMHRCWHVKSCLKHEI